MHNARRAAVTEVKGGPFFCPDRLDAAPEAFAYFRLAQKRWMRLQASSRASVEVA